MNTILGLFVRQVIEQLHIECPPQPINHTEPHFTALRINGQDCWVRDVVCDETMNSVAVSGQRITLERVSVNRKARHQGSSRPGEFSPNAGQVLLDRCSVNADNVWFVASGGRQAGPIVLLNCAFLGDSRAESHQRWSTGMLYDNCRTPQGGIEFPLTNLVVAIALALTGPGLYSLDTVLGLGLPEPITLMLGLFFVILGVLAALLSQVKPAVGIGQTR